eukprot:gb/GEZN01006268.1/.p1 GENE.gb/GEZN01006268.1/~~gb/GEZN01006268.1/.p1  ORF type:complete len:386 (-),score=84.06 gb/GEZN01006268.1/:529-1650(-)
MSSESGESAVGERQGETVKEGQVTGKRKRDDENASSSEGGGTPTMEELKALVQAREDARKDKDFTRADEIRDQLKGYGVSLYDKDKVWKTESGEVGIIPTWNDGKSGRRGGGYQGEESRAMCTLTTAAINVFVQAREAARKEKNWSQADKIRDELKAHGVSIYDKDGLWKSTDGRSEMIAGAGRGGVGTHAVLGGGYGSGGGGGYGSGGHGSPMSQAAQQAMLYAALAQQQQSATAPLGLYSYSGVNEGMPHSEPGSAYGTLPPTHAQQSYGGGGGGGGNRGAPPSPYGAMGGQGMIGGGQGGLGGGGQGSMIEELVQQREQARARKDFQAADYLRTRLQGMGVEIMDKEKRWTQASTGLEGTVPLYNTFLKS